MRETRQWRSRGFTGEACGRAPVVVCGLLARAGGRCVVGVPVLAGGGSGPAWCAPRASRARAGAVSLRPRGGRRISAWSGARRRRRSRLGWAAAAAASSFASARTRMTGSRVNTFLRVRRSVASMIASIPPPESTTRRAISSLWLCRSARVSGRAVSRSSRNSANGEGALAHHSSGHPPGDDTCARDRSAPYQ